MIIWSGWGFIVAILFVVGFMIGVPVGGLVSADSDTAMAVAVIVAGLLTGLGSFLLARKLEGGEGRAFIDEATGQRIVVRRSAGSLFFVPTRYWAYVAPILGIAFAALVMTTPATSGPDAPARTVEEAPAQGVEEAPVAPQA